LLDAVLAAVEHLTGSYPTPCTLGFITDAETEVRPVVEMLATLLAMQLHAEKPTVRYMHSTKRVLFCIRLTTRVQHNRDDSPNP
jgi:hypothetical protein